MIFLSPCRFQSTFPRGERHLCWLVAVKHIHFNPRSLVGNDYIPVGTYTIVEISIHVPSWGTTAQAGYNQWDNPISIHVPSWGTTYPYSGICTEASISIHVPSWGTTLRCIRWYRTVRISIHVPSWGTT